MDGVSLWTHCDRAREARPSRQEGGAMIQNIDMMELRDFFRVMVQEEMMRALGVRTLGREFLVALQAGGPAVKEILDRDPPYLHSTLDQLGAIAESGEARNEIPYSPRDASCAR